MDMKEGAFIRSEGKLFLGRGAPSWGAAPRGAISFYLPDFFLDAKAPWLNFPEAELSDSPKGRAEGAISRTFSPPDRALFMKLLEGWEERLEKVVPYLTMAAEPLSKEELAALFNTLFLSDQTIYAFWTEEGGMVGATPELLFARKGSDSRRIETMALAGTRGDHPTEESFLNDPKELYEHALVVKGIEEAFADAGRVERGRLSLKRAGFLTHLMTPLAVKLNQPLPFEEIVRRLHPTPALGAYPKEAGSDWLRGYAKALPRGRFGAPVGVCYQGEEQVFVAIRQMQWTKESMWLTAGAGVTKRSDLGREVDEIERKLKATWRLMGGRDH